MKKTVCIVVFLFILLNVNCFTQENKQLFLFCEEGIFSKEFAFSFYNGNGYLEICFNSLANYWIDPDYDNDPGGDGLIYQIFQGHYSETKRDPFTIVHLGNKSMLYLPSSDGRVAYVIPLKDDGEGRWPVFCGTKKELFDNGYFVTSSHVTKTSSHLTETIRGKKYSYDLTAFPAGAIRYGQMWAESGNTIWVAGGSGIGESITLKTETGNTSGIILQNGFIAPWNLDLYYQNSRVKKIRVEYKGFSEIVEIVDTPNPQIIDVKRNGVEEAKITILEVYPGTKYKDVAISSVHFLTRR